MNVTQSLADALQGSNSIEGRGTNGTWDCMFLPPELARTYMMICQCDNYLFVDVAVTLSDDKYKVWDSLPMQHDGPL